MPETRKLSDYLAEELTHFDGINAGANALVPLANVRRQLLATGPTVNVMDHGATGLGVVDETAAIQAAITFSEMNCRAVYFPSGVFLCNIVVPAGIIISGSVESSALADDRVAILKPFIPANPVIRVPEPTGVTISNLSLLGPGAYIAGSTGIRIAKTTPGDQNVFVPGSAIIRGVQAIGFESNFFVASYRIIFDQCAAREGKFNFYLANPNTGIATATPSGGYPSDHILLRDCVAGLLMKTSAGVYEVSGSATSYGIFAQDVRSLHIIGGDVGQVGTGIYAQRTAGYFQGLLEGCDVVGARMDDSLFMLSPLATLNSGGILLEHNSKVTLGPCSTNGSYAGGIAFVGIKGSDSQLRSDFPVAVKYMDSGGTLIGYGMSNGSRLTAVRAALQTIATGNIWNAVLWDGVADGDYIETGANNNFDITTGKWKCPKSARYRFSIILDKNEPGAGRFFSKVDEWNNVTVVRDFRINNYEVGNNGIPLVGSIEIECTAGFAYSISVLNESATGVSVGGGNSPSSGSASSRFMIAPV